MTALVSEILAFCDELLEPDGFEDLGPNGLQVPGRREVDRVVTAVSGHLELIERAVGAGAGLVLVHHGILWDFLPRRLEPPLAARLRALLTHEVALAAYHLPLDAHPEVGNNALLAAGLGCVAHAPFGLYRGRAIGVAGDFAGDGVAWPDLHGRIAGLTAREPLAFPFGPARVRRLGIVSGAGTSALAEAARAGLDAFLTGEPAEHAMADAREASIHYVAAGHYATETFGIRRLGELVAERFDVTHDFIDVPNPV